MKIILPACLLFLAIGCATAPHHETPPATKRTYRKAYHFNSNWYKGSPHEKIPLKNALIEAAEHSGLESDFRNMKINYAMRPGTRSLKAGDAFHLPRLAWLHVYVQKRRPHDYKITCAIPADEHAPDTGLAAPDDRIRFFACAIIVLLENDIRPTRETINVHFEDHPLGSHKDTPRIYYATLTPAGAMVIDETYRQ